MNCERVSLQLEEYLDNELPEPDRLPVEAHLSGCALCSEAYESLEREQEMFGRYVRPIEPGEAMWAAVRARIETGEDPAKVVRGRFGRRGLFVPLVAAACLVAVAGIGFVAWRNSTGAMGGGETIARQGSANAPGEAGQSGTEFPAQVPNVTSAKPVERVAGARVVSRARRQRPATAAERIALPTPVAKAEQNYLSAIALLSTEIDRKSGSNPEVSRAARKPLQDLDANIRTARRVVEQNPNDPIAVNSMLSAYDEKVETMQRLVALQARFDR